MSIGDHMAEIARQGIWASLTGGWYYEPAHSLFCNVAHLYAWLLLFVIPLIIGIVSTTVSWTLIIPYAIGITVFFGTLKCGASYLHQLFDTTEPIIVTKVKERKTQEAVKPRLRTMGGTDGLYEMVEMRMLNRRDERWVLPSGGGTTTTNVEAVIHPRRISEEEGAPHRIIKSGEMSETYRKMSEPVISPRIRETPNRVLMTSSLEEDLEKDMSANSLFVSSSAPHVLAGGPSTSYQPTEFPIEDNEIIIEEVENDAIHNSQSEEDLSDEWPLRKIWNQETNDVTNERDERKKKVVMVPESSRAIVQMDDRPGPSHENVDLKGEITKFLEELIDKHPETLDAIESVRMSRLGKKEGPRVAPLHINNRDEPSAVTALTEIVRDGTHVALGHDDTTQGAIHSFQDDEGNWFTYAFDDHGVGTARALGSGRALRELLNQVPSMSEPPLPNMYNEFSCESSDEEFDDLDHKMDRIVAPVAVTNRRRERAASSSSNESHTYLPTIPASVLFAPPGRSRNAEMFAGVTRAGRSHDNEIPHRLSAELSFLNSTAGGLPLMDFTGRRVSNTKRKYYYKMKLFPKSSKTLQIKMDRLSLAALLDRNRSFFSIAFDAILAAVLAVVCSLVLCSGVYHDVTLIAYAFVVAGAHFSLLKSVQPDASSPVHGFNWQVAYSRPFYLLVLSVSLLMLNTLVSDPGVVPWNWNIYRFSSSSYASLVIAVRDVLSTLIIFLPLIFTLGWVPQVSTLVHHVFEQIEMLVFGGTASFGPLCAVVHCGLSALVTVILTGVSILVHSQSTSVQSMPFSILCALFVSSSFLLSRFSTNPAIWFMFGRALKCSMFPGCAENVSDPPIVRDDIPPAVELAIFSRLRRDIFFFFLFLLFSFGLHSTSLFTAAQPYITFITAGITFIFGCLNHYLYMQMRTHTPWKVLARPILRGQEFGTFESNVEAHLMYFERIHVWMVLIEKNILYPLVVLSCITGSGWSFSYAPYILPLVAMRILRGGFGHPQMMYVPLGLAFLISFVDVISIPYGLTPMAIFPYVFFLLVVVHPKFLELQLKLHFVLAYIAPWQISWGSAFHAFAQPFTVPHSVLISLQTLISTIISAPLNPFLGSSFITVSYARPVKFWERDYNTQRSDASNTRLSSQLERGPMLDDSNLNAVFYEHLTRSLQLCMAGDLMMGRWGSSVHPGDCFILASFYLNCLVHIVEVGNGFVTFQLRGLEFRGTYCHQREVEAITEDSTEGGGWCCCSPGNLPGVLSLNTAWGLRWLAWEVTASKLIVDGYSITDNSAVNLLQVHELRRLLLTLYTKCIIFYSLTFPRILEWLTNETIVAALEPIEKNPRYVDVDHMFCSANDEDYDMDMGGISRNSFSKFYRGWMQFCFEKNTQLTEGDPGVVSWRESRVSSLCFALSLLGRRTLGTATYNRHSNAAESFLYGLHTLFKGDFRVTCTRDEWVFSDMDLLRCVIAPSIRMALKLHQDHFSASEDLEDPKALYNLILEHQQNMFISHEHDPEWREAIMANTPSLLALRHMYDDGQDDYKVIMLNRMHLNMRVIKLNRECVRAFWSGQQQELVFLRNRNPERGSIQNARQVLRNMINSSADQPIGYPIYVSPLTTSFVETHPQIERMTGSSFSFHSFLSSTLTNLRSHFGLSNSSNVQSSIPARTREAKEETTCVPFQSLHMENSVVHYTAEGARVSLCKTETPPTVEQPREEPEQKTLYVEVINEDEVFKSLHEPLKATGEPLVVWPREAWRTSNWRMLYEKTSLVGMAGKVVHSWHPNHPQKAFRSHIGGIIHLVMMFDIPGAYIPIGEKGVRVLPDSFGESRMLELEAHGWLADERFSSLCNQ